MTHRGLALLLVGGLLTGLLQGPARSQDTGPEQQAEMMRKWAEFATPGEHHKALERYLGTWDLTFRMVMPGMPSQVSKGEAVYRWQLAGRWLAQEVRGTVMGMPYQGFGLLGYDNFKKKYVGSWCDSTSTALLSMEGVVVDPSLQVSVTYGTMDEFLTGEHDRISKYLTRWVDDDNFVFEIHDMGIGPEGAVVMELTYTRRT